MKEPLLEAIYDFCAIIPPQKAAVLIHILHKQVILLTANEYGRICGLSNDLIFSLSKLLNYFSAPAELATALETGVFFQQKNQASRLSFVWSGLSQFFTDTRKTEQVILDIINGAKEQIMLVSFAAYKIPSLLGALQCALKRGIRIRIILESSHDSCGQLTLDGKYAFKELENAEFFHWPLSHRTRNTAGLPAKMHAKCAINENCFLVTSANLTNDAVNANIELGVFINDKYDAKKLITQFELLIGKNLLVRYF